mgnify:CR=1 FL=1
MVDQRDDLAPRRTECDLGVRRLAAALFLLSVPLTAQAFVSEVLVERLCVREVWIGPGFRFGKGRAGDAANVVLSAVGHNFRRILAGALPAAVSARFAVLFGGGVVAANAALLLTSRRLRRIG